MAQKLDRATEDLGNIVALEHVNVRIPDQRLSTLFYVTGLGLTRDPYLMTSTNNMWVNVGRSQFHLPTGEPQRLRGMVGLVIPDLEGLVRRLERVREPLEDTAFDFAPANDHVDATSPWGNLYRLHPPGERFGRMRLGMAYVRADVPVGSADGIARFYDEVVGADASSGEDDGAPAAFVSVGHNQSLVFRESEAPAADYDDHHIQVYVANFSGPYERLRERGLVSQEDGQHQYRFRDIVDPDSGETLFTLEHEVRSMTHPLYARPLINRNPDHSNWNYVLGYENEPAALPI